MHIAKKNSLPLQYYLSFSVINDEVVYILVSIKFHQGKDMDSVHYYCVFWGFNTRTWQRCDDDTISEFRGYPGSVYNESSQEDLYKKEEYIYYESIG